MMSGMTEPSHEASEFSLPEDEVGEWEREIEKEWAQRLAPWEGIEGVPVSERLYTPWAREGWEAWNQYGPEVPIAVFLQNLMGYLSQNMETPVVVETGVGQGYITRRLNDSKKAADLVFCFESDVAWRKRLSRLDWWTCCEGRPVLDPDVSTPPQFLIQAADLVILDSNDPWRMAELCLWAACGKPGSLLFVHDTGNGHPTWDGHFNLGMLIRTLQLEGIWLENPRGAFLGCMGEVPQWAQSIWTGIVEQVYRQHT